MLKANAIQHDNYFAQDLDKMNRALALIENTINNDPFKVAVKNFAAFQFTTYRCSISGPRVVEELEHFTNEQILQKILLGHSQIAPDTFMDLKLVLSNGGGTSTVGETDNNGVTTTYRHKFDEMTDGQLAAHYTHEWTHTLGFGHSRKNKCDKTRDCLSVPYAIGNLIELITTGTCWYGCKYESLK